MPDVGVAVFPVAFGVEAVGLGYASGLVVAADQVHARWVAQFEADEEGDGLDGEEAPVDVVAWMEYKVSDFVESIVLRSQLKRLCCRTCEHSWKKLTQEKVIGVWTKPANLENLNHIEELPMYISNHSDRRCDMYNIALLHQQFLCFGTYCLYDRVGKQFFLVESFDTFVEINAC